MTPTAAHAPLAGSIDCSINARCINLTCGYSTNWSARHYPRALVSFLRNSNPRRKRVADDYPEIVNLLVVGQTEMGRNLWMLQISDWSQETKPDGTEKDVVYIDGGHHGNEHLGTELAFLVAEYYIEGWASGQQKVLEVLATT